MCRRLCDGQSKEGADLARWLVEHQWAAIAKQCRAAVRNQPNPKLVFDAACRTSKPVLGLLESSLIADRPELHREMLRLLMAPDTAYPIHGLVHLLQTAHDTRPGRKLPDLALRVLHEHCAQALAVFLERPLREKTDWSIPAPRTCTCRLCETLARFLSAPDELQLEWPLAKNQRAHIHHIIDSHDLPVGHVTRRIGRPFTLVLTKTEALFERDAAERTEWERDFRWLTRTARAF